MSSSSVNGREQGRWPRRIMVALTMATLSSASVRTMAAADEALRCQIPFSFTIDKATLPPGTYRVVVDEAVGMLEVRDLHHGAFAVGIPFDAAGSRETKLVFHRYGDTYVLREVWTGFGPGRELPEPKSEKALEASLHSGRESARFERVEVPAL